MLGVTVHSVHDSIASLINRFISKDPVGDVLLSMDGTQASDLVEVCLAAVERMVPGDNCSPVEKTIAKAIVDGGRALEKRDGERRSRLIESSMERSREIADEIARGEEKRKALARDIVAAVPHAFVGGSKSSSAGAVLEKLSSLGELGTDGVMAFGLSSALLPAMTDPAGRLEISRITESNIPRLVDAYLSVPGDERKTIQPDFGVSPEQALRNGLSDALERVMAVRRAEVDRLKSAVAIEALVIADKAPSPSGIEKSKEPGRIARPSPG